MSADRRRADIRRIVSDVGFEPNAEVSLVVVKVRFSTYFGTRRLGGKVRSRIREAFFRHSIYRVDHVLHLDDVVPNNDRF